MSELPKDPEGWTDVSKKTGKAIPKQFKLQTTEIDPETGAVTSKVVYAPAFARFFKQFQEVKNLITPLKREYPEDVEVLDKLYTTMDSASRSLKIYLTKKYPQWRRYLR